MKLERIKQRESFNNFIRRSLTELSGSTPLQLRHNLKKDWDTWCDVIKENNQYDTINKIIHKKYLKSIADISEISPASIVVNENTNKKDDIESIHKDITTLLDGYDKLTLDALMWATLCTNTGKKMRLTKYLKEQNADYSKDILEIFMLIYQDELINESIDLNKILQKIGFTFSKEKGLIQILTGTGKHMFTLFKALLTAWYTGTDEDKQKVKEIIDSTEITREHVVDFLFKLDEVTLHLLTGPLYLLSAITGWKIRPKDPHKQEIVQNTETKLKDALQKLSTVVNELPKKLAKNFRSYLKGMMNLVCRDLNICQGEQG